MKDRNTVMKTSPLFEQIIAVAVVTLMVLIFAPVFS